MKPLKLLRTTAATVGLVTALGAAAAPLDAFSTVDTALGADTGTLDSITGLVWLDIRLSRPFSYDQLVGTELGAGGMFDGFRFATRDEVGTFVSNSGILPPLADAAARDGFSALIAQIGPLAASTDISGDGCVLGLVGVAADFHAGGFVNNRLNQDAIDGCQSPGPDDLGSFNNLANDNLFGLLQDEVIQDHFPAQIAGAWLVQAAAVPAPSAALLLALGIGVLTWRQRAAS